LEATNGAVITLVRASQARFRKLATNSDASVRPLLLVDSSASPADDPERSSTRFLGPTLPACGV